jgi:hypothetical protein
MSNPFLNSTTRMIDQHGQSVTYTKVTEGTYNIETGSTTNTDTTYTVKMYKKHIKSNQYNYPNLIGRNAALFYLANQALAFVPETRDKITVNGEVFEVEAIVEHSARGQIVLYKLIAVKG